MSATEEGKFEIGMAGLGVMGRNLLLNIAGRGFPAAGYDKDPAKLRALEAESSGLPVRAAAGPRELAALLRRPRAVIILVPAGAPVDAVIASLEPFLEKGDLLIDAGNSYYKDTERRTAALAAKGLRFLGMGVSGGEEGARRGPSLMPGGDRDAYERVRPALEAAAARAGGEPCAAWLGPGSAGHFVKMTHNGIEYALMQLIAESYDLLKRGLGLDDDALAGVYSGWNEGELNSYLLEITARIFARRDERTGGRLVDEILDVARQKGTGLWTVQAAMELQVPVPTIDAAVAMRDLSAYEAWRAAAPALLGGAPGRAPGLSEGTLRRALRCAFLLAYAQGMSLLSAASRARGYGLDLKVVAGIWRGGCIIRAAALEDIRAAYARNPALPNLLLDPAFAAAVSADQAELRAAVSAAAAAGLPVPALMSALAYYDALRGGWLPANLIQAQRDYFGAHGYELKDAKGVFHTEWSGAAAEAGK